MKKLLLFVNPYSGKKLGLEYAQKIKDFLQDKDFLIDEVISERTGFLHEYMLKNDLSSYEMIGIVGGDGTMSEVVNAIFQKDAVKNPPLLLFPAGSGNAFNHDLMNLDFEKSLQKIISPKYKKIDVLEYRNATQKYYSFNIIGWGLVSQITQTSETLRWMPDVRYTLAAVWNIFKNPKFRGKITVGIEKFEGDFCFVLLCNTKFTGKAMKMAPFADLEDGLVDVLIIKHLSMLTLLQLFPLIFSGKHIESENLTFRQSSKITVEAEPSALVVDGEIMLTTPYTVEVKHQSLLVVV